MPRRACIDFTALEAVLRAQDGVISFQQLAALDFPSSTLGSRLTAEGSWQRLLPGVCLTASGEPTTQQRARAALVYAGEGAVITGAEALRRYGFRSAPTSVDVHVLIPHERRRASKGFVIVERTRRMPPPVLLQDLTCAPVARSVIDTCRRTKEFVSVQAIIAEAVQRGRCSVAELAHELAEGSIRGSAHPRRVLADVQDGVRSVAEASARKLFREAKLPAPVWNCDLYTEGGLWIARPDAWWDDVAVVLEVESREWHLGPEDWERTMRRHMRMTALGIIVLHVPPSRVRDDGPALVAEIRAALAMAAARPRPRIMIRRNG